MQIEDVSENSESIHQFQNTIDTNHIYKNFFDQRDLRYNTRAIVPCLSPERETDTPDTKRRKKRSQKRKIKNEKEKLKDTKCEMTLYSPPPKKKIKVIYLQLMTTDINPLVNVRVVDHVFPLDSTCLLNSQQKPEIQFVFGDLRTIKRIRKVEHDQERGTWGYFLEEKFPEKEPIFKGAGTFGYFKEWQQSMGDWRCQILASHLDAKVESRNQIESQISALQLKENSKRIYQKQLNSQTHEFMKSIPYVNRIHTFTEGEENSFIGKIVVNDLLMEIVYGRKSAGVDLFGMHEGWDTILSVVTESWINIWTGYVFLVS